MIKYLLHFSSYLLTLGCVAQQNGVLPLTGIKYFKEGIGGNIDVRIDGAVLLNNKLPIGKEIEVKVQSVTGFSEKNKLFHPAAEVIIVSSKGEVLSKVPNVMKDNSGYSIQTYKDIGLKIALPAAQIKNEASCTIKIRFYDLYGKNQLRLEFPVIIAKPGELAISKSASEIKKPGAIMWVNGVKIKGIQTSVDTTIRVSPKMAYTSVVIADLDGTNMNEVLGGRESFWVYDQQLNEIKITDKLLKQVKGAMEDDRVEYTLKIPFRLKTNKDKYIVRFRWESRDMKKILDIVTNN